MIDLKCFFYYELSDILMFIVVETIGAGATWAAFAVALKTTAVESETFAAFAIAARGGSGLPNIRFCGDFLLH